MKRILSYCFLLILTVTFTLNMTQGMYTVANKTVFSDFVDDNDRAQISSAVILSGVADTSLQQSADSGISHFASKQRTVQFSLYNNFGKILERKGTAYHAAYKIVHDHFREYCALQKNTGYYIYMLRKIVI